MTNDNMSDQQQHQSIRDEVVYLAKLVHTQHTRVEELTHALAEAAVPLETLWAVEMDNDWPSPELKQSIAKAVKAIRIALGVSTEGL